ncbi:MAG: amidohydrolase family protein [Candidatus Binatia bacterium]
MDLGGATVLPGLVDPHLHLFALAARDAHLDCARFDTVDMLLVAVAARARALPPGTWVRGEGLDEVRLGRLPYARELDAAAPGHPVRLRHRSRHASVLNGRALRCLGPSPGVERIHGVPTGLVSGREELLSRRVGPLPRADLEAGLATAAHALAARGVTTVADATPRTWIALAPLRRVMAAGRFPLRVFAMRPSPRSHWRPTPRLAPGPVKIMVQEEGTRLRPNPATLARRIRAAADAGVPVAVHCLGTATLVAALAAFAALPAAVRRRARHRLEHVAECPPPLVARIARLGLAVVTNPALVRERGDVYLADPDGPPAAWLYRAASLAAAGVPLAAASDAPVTPLDPWLGMATARTRRTAIGRVLGGSERLTSAAALGLFTTGAAWSLGADGLGRLVPGGAADLIAVEPDPLRATPDELHTTRVRLAMVGGEVVFSR